MVLDLNRQAQKQLTCENDLAVVEGASHLFEEPGTLAEAALLARDWFARHLLRRAGRHRPSTTRGTVTAPCRASSSDTAAAAEVRALARPLSTAPPTSIRSWRGAGPPATSASARRPTAPTSTTAGGLGSAGG